MRRTLKVGKGFFKKSVDIAIEVAEEEDTLLFDPGVYSIPVLPKNINLKGSTENPDDVIITTNSIINNNTTTFENITFKYQNDNQPNILQFVKCNITLNNCKFISNNTSLISENSNLNINNSQLFGRCVFKGSSSSVNISDVHIMGSMYACCANNIVLSNLNILNNNIKHGLTIEQSTIKGNNITVKYTNSSNINHLAISILKNSNVNFSNLNVIGCTKLTNSILTLSNDCIFNGPIILNRSSILKNKTSKLNINNSSLTQLNDSTFIADNLISKVENSIRISGNSTLRLSEINSPKTNISEVKYSNASLSIPSTSNVEVLENVEPQDTDIVHMSALDKLNNLVGLSCVKNEVSKFVKTAHYNQERKQAGKKSISLSLHSLFLGNPGTGKTTVARLLGKVMYEEGILPKDAYVEVDASDLIAEYVGQTAPKTKKLLESALGGVFFLDEAYSLTTRGNFGREALDTILKFMEDNRNNIMIIFAGYEKEMNALLDMNSGLRSRFPNEFHFENYTAEEITKLGLMSLDNDFDIDKDAYVKAIKQVYNPKLHDNGRWIRTMNEKLEQVAVSQIEDKNKPNINKNIICDVFSINNRTQNDACALDKLNEIIGLNKVKEEVQKFIDVSKMNRQRLENGYKANEIALHSLFLGNPGTGKTTVARLLGKIMYEEGILPKDVYVEADASDLIAEHVGQTAPKTKKLLESALGGVFFLDEAYSLTTRSSFGREALDTILKFMEDNRNDIMIIFAGYEKEMNELLDMNSGLRSRFPNEFHFENYSNKEIIQIGLKMLYSKGGISIDENAYSNAINSSYNPILCDNARWIRVKNSKLIEEAQHRQLNEANGCIESQISIIQEDIDKVFELNRANEEQESALKEINSLIGLKSVKKQTESFINIAKVNKIRQEQNLPALNRTFHSLFLGNPGTGKTTVANLLGKALYQEGVIQRNQCTTVKREDLVAGYIGQTATKTKKVLEQNLGGVLFVDEAYTLASGGANDFGREALDTILAFMEEHRNDIVIIFAGYNKEMEHLLATNSGLKSRFPNIFQFEDYTKKEAVEIGTKMLIKQKYQFNFDLYNQIMGAKYEEAQSTGKKEYANARGIRNLNQKLLSIQENSLFSLPPEKINENVAVISDDNLNEFKQVEI